MEYTILSLYHVQAVPFVPKLWPSTEIPYMINRGYSKWLRDHLTITKVAFITYKIQFFSYHIIGTNVQL